MQGGSVAARFSRWMLVAGLIVGLVAPVLGSTSNKDDDIARLQSAEQVFHSIMATPDKGIPKSILDDAACIAIIPGEKKVAFGVGASYGKGVVSCRNPVSHDWEAPLFITVGGGSWGLQIGAQSADVILVFHSRAGLDSLLSSKFRIGADASAAAGPVGRQVSAATDVDLNSEILSYSRAKGAFAGISLNGAVVQPDTTGNAAMYGADTPVKSIVDGKVAIPPSARPLIRELTTNPTTSPASK